LRRYVAGEPLKHEITRERAALMACHGDYSVSKSRQLLGIRLR
jgi:hypothetical protein